MPFVGDCLIQDPSLRKILEIKGQGKIHDRNSVSIAVQLRPDSRSHALMSHRQDRQPLLALAVNITNVQLKCSGIKRRERRRRTLALDTHNAKGFQPKLGKGDTGKWLTKFVTCRPRLSSNKIRVGWFLRSPSATRRSWALAPMRQAFQDSTALRPCLTTGLPLSCAIASERSLPERLVPADKLIKSVCAPLVKRHFWPY